MTYYTSDGSEFNTIEEAQDYVDQYNTKAQIEESMNSRIIERLSRIEVITFE